MVETQQFLGVPGIDGWLFLGLSIASAFTSFVAVATGTGGGLLLLAIMALVFAPAVLVPTHTVIMFVAGSHVVFMMWRYTIRSTLFPFFGGSAVGAALGAQIFIALPAAILQGIIGLLILILTWLPKFAQLGSTKYRFAVVGTVATFIGMFVSATGTLIAPFVASASPDRRNHVATMSALMSFSHIVKIIAFGALGVTVGSYIPLIVSMVATAMIGNWIGGKTLDRMPERMFRWIFRVLVTILAIRLLWVAFSNLETV